MTDNGQLELDPGTIIKVQQQKISQLTFEIVKLEAAIEQLMQGGAQVGEGQPTAELEAVE